IVLLTLSTVAALVALCWRGQPVSTALPGASIWNPAGIGFLIALMGWMPSAIDISVWSSLWTLERGKQTGYRPSLRESLLDFNIGYVGAVFSALAFMALGALTMFGSGASFSESGAVFANQFVAMYTRLLGSWSHVLITVAAFSAMF